MEYFQGVSRDVDKCATLPSGLWGSSHGAMWDRPVWPDTAAPNAQLLKCTAKLSKIKMHAIIKCIYHSLTDPNRHQ